MKAYETSATVEGEGQVRIAGVPFAAGTEVEVTIHPKRGAAEEFAAAWNRVCLQMRSETATRIVGDDEIHREIVDHRAGR